MDLAVTVTAPQMQAPFAVVVSDMGALSAFFGLGIKSKPEPSFFQAWMILLQRALDVHKTAAQVQSMRSLIVMGDREFDRFGLDGSREVDRSFDEQSTESLPSCGGVDPHGDEFGILGCWCGFVPRAEYGY